MSFLIKSKLLAFVPRRKTESCFCLFLQQKQTSRGREYLDSIFTPHACIEVVHLRNSLTIYFDEYVIGVESNAPQKNKAVIG